MVCFSRSKTTIHFRWRLFAWRCTYCCLIVLLCGNNKSEWTQSRNETCQLVCSFLFQKQSPSWSQGYCHATYPRYPLHSRWTYQGAWLGFTLSPCPSYDGPLSQLYRRGPDFTYLTAYQKLFSRPLHPCSCLFYGWQSPFSEADMDIGGGCWPTSSLVPGHTTQTPYKVHGQTIWWEASKGYR